MKKKILFKSALFLSIAFVYYSFSFDKEKKYFEVLDTTYRTWATGANSGGKGISYQLELRINSDKKITFDSAWVNQYRYLVEVTKGKQRNYKQPLSKNDTAIVQVIEFIPENVPVKAEDGSLKKKEERKPIVAPITYDGKVLFRYYVNGQKKYYTVKEFKKAVSPLNR
jgi:hypothetical protein